MKGVDRHITYYMAVQGVLQYMREAVLVRFNAITPARRVE
jgi:hypothetical protein